MPFQVKLKKHLPDGVNLVLAESCFGRWGLPMEFSINDSGTDDFITIKFIVTEREKKEALELDHGDLIDLVKEVHIKGASRNDDTFSINRPVLLALKRENVVLTCSFMVHPQKNAEQFVFAIEFYQEAYPVPTQSELSEGSDL
jgi:hypothetical protein